MSQYNITTDLFTLPYKEDKSVLYAPLLGFSCMVNNDTINFLADLESFDNENLGTMQKEILDFLIKKGVINGSLQKIQNQFLNKELSPLKLTLFPTNDCNLNCRYCYASNEHLNPKVMDWDIAVSSIDYFIKLMKEEGRDLFPLEFHGGGEPLFAWNLVQNIVDYTQKCCQQEGFELKVISATNGLLNEDQLKWLINYFSSINVSFDVLPHVQDYHRPMVNKKGSFDLVHRTLKFFDKYNFPYCIRCTVSSYNEDLLYETIDFVSQNYNTKLLYLEPAYICNGCVSYVNKLKPDLNKFIENFKKLETIYTDRGLQLGYSGAQFEKIASNFCYVGTDNFAVTPDGYLTNCWEVSSYDHPLANTFLFGRILSDGKISVDKVKLDYLRSLSVHNLEYCRDCFAKWHCAGDCITKLGHSQFYGPRGGARCRTNRNIIAHRIIQMMERENYYQVVS